MSSKKNKLLFISHDATRTGAPILLLNLVKAIKDEFEIDFLLKNGGELYKEFSLVAATSIAAKPLRRTLFSRVLKKFRKQKIKNDFHISNLDWKKYDFVISNTITNGDILPEVRKYYKRPIISYIHELEMATSFFTNPENLKRLIECSNGYFVPAEAVRNHLINNLGIDANKIELLSYYIPPIIKHTISHNQKNKDFIVGSIGTLDWRKSPDLFIIIANTLFKKLPKANIKFIWKGAASGIVEMDRLKYDIKKLGLENKISFLEASSDVTSFYSSLNLFLLTSREDPYPLVVLEAANEEVPTICFDKAGGSPEFVINSNGGRVISYLDINEAADAISYYYTNQDKLRDDGKNAKIALQSTHQSIGYIKNQFMNALGKIQMIL